MLSTLFIVSCTMQIAHYSRHWLRLTNGMLEDQREKRLKTHLNWKTQKRAALGSTARGSALARGY